MDNLFLKYLIVFFRDSIHNSYNSNPSQEVQRMLTLRPALERGHAQLNWLDSYHTFSFSHYYDPNHMGFGPLRVINDDRIAPRQGFPTHGHQDMEIITVILSGALEHRDSLGTGSIIYPGDVQRMSAGTGIRHSEYNASSTEPVHLLQIWIEPDQRGLPPSYEQKQFPLTDREGRLRLLASPDGREGSITIHQAADLYGAIVQSGDSLSHSLKNDRQAWIQVAQGSLVVNGQSLQAGDGLAITDTPTLEIQGTEQTGEILLFDLPKI